MRRLAQSAFIHVAANAASSIAQWLVVVILARAYGSHVLGAYALILAVVSPLFLLGGMNMRVLAGSLPERDYDPAALLRLQRAGIALAAAASLCVAVLLGPREGLSAGLVAAVVAIKIIETSAEGRYGFLLREHLAWPIAVRRVARAAGTVGVLFVLAHVAGCAPGPAMAGVFAASLGVFLLLDLRHVPAAAAAPARPSGGRALLRLALLSGAAAALDSLVIAVPRLGLGTGSLGAGSLAAVGAFTILVQIPMVGAVVVSGIGQTILNRLRAAHGRRAFLGLLAGAYVVVGALGLAGTVLAAWLGDVIVATLYGPDFQGAAVWLGPVMWGALAWYLAGISGVGLQARGRHDAQLAATLAAVFAAILAMLVQPATLQAAVHAYLAAMVARLAVSGAALAWDLLLWAPGAQAGSSGGPLQGRRP